MSLADLIQKRLADNPVLGELAKPSATPETEPLQNVLKGRSVELWSDSAGRLLIVADQADAQAALERLGTRLGEIYTADEVRLIIALTDPEVIAEINEWKRLFDGVIRELRPEDPK